MIEQSGSFFTLSVLVIGAVLAIFAMRYAAQMLRARADAAMAGETDLRLASVEEKSGDLDQRVARLEAMLREVE